MGLFDWFRSRKVERERPPSGSVCDICNRQTGVDGGLYSAQEIRDAASAGLRPSKLKFGNRPGVTGADVAALLGLSTDEDDAAWLSHVRQDTTDWALCGECAPTVDEYLASR